MKKLFLLSIILFQIIFNNKIFGFSSESSWWFFDNNFENNFYSNIYENIDKLEKNYTEKTMIEWIAPNNTSWNSISKNLEKILKEKQIIKDCSLRELSMQDVYLVVYNGDFTSIYNALSDCENPVNTNTLQRTIKELTNLYKENKLIRTSKVDNIQKIWKIWLYSDWVLENAPFDLIYDMLQIEKIIFEKKYEEYIWVNDFDLWSYVESHKSPNTSWTPLNFDSFKYDDFKDENNKNHQSEHNKNNIWNIDKIIINDWNNQICPTNDSWFDDETFNLLTWKNNSNPKSNNTSWNTDKNSNENENKENNGVESNEWEQTDSNYKQVNDNKVWPCNNIFCIIVEFVIYNHNLLWWNNKDKSIEQIIKESNEHLKKFTNTSLVQSKMTVNLAENVLKDLDLPSIFHVWIVVSKKPVPMLNIDKSEKAYDARNDFWSKNLLERYFKAYWLEYKRQNDLSKIELLEWQLKSILDWEELNKTEAWEKFQDFVEEIKKNKKEIWFVDLAVQNHVISEDMKKFDEQCKELSKFVRELQEYVATLFSIYKKMIEIPISWK